MIVLKIGTYTNANHAEIRVKQTLQHIAEYYLNKRVSGVVRDELLQV